MCKSFENTTSNPEVLWDQFIRGDMYSFRCIYTKHYQNLYSFGLQYLTPIETEDSIQNLFLYILQHRKSLSKINNVKSYLFISFRNQIIKLRKTKNLDYIDIDLETIINTESTQKKESVINELLAFLTLLSPRENEIIRLKYFQKYKNKEIARSLNIECQTVRNILYNAIKKLKKAKFQTSL